MAVIGALVLWRELVRFFFSFLFLNIDAPTIVMEVTNVMLRPRLFDG